MCRRAWLGTQKHHFGHQIDLKIYKNEALDAQEGLLGAIWPLGCPLGLCIQVAFSALKIIVFAGDRRQKSCQGQFSQGTVDKNKDATRRGESEQLAKRVSAFRSHFRPSK